MRKPSFPYLNIIDRYLLGELYKTFLAVASILVLIVASNNFVRSLGKVVDGEYDSDVLISLMGYELLPVIGSLLPPAFFFAILISLGRLYRDSEMTALQCSGFSTFSVYRTYVMGALPVVVIVSVFVFFVLPWSVYSKDQLLAGQKTASEGIANITVGQFQELQEGKTIFFAEASGRKPGEVRQVFIQNWRDGEQGIITAKEGYQYITDEGDHYLVLKEGYRYVGEPGTSSYKRSRFHEYGVRIRQADTRKTGISIDATPTVTLMQSTDLEERAILQSRLSIPLAVLAFSFLAVPLSRSLPRQGIYGRLFLAFVVYFTFMNIHRLAYNWMLTGKIPDWLGLWWVPLLAFLMAMLIELRDRYHYLLRPRWLRS